jgi:hypothetical protein
MKLSTVDAVTDFEQCLSDALKNAQRDRLKIEARLATSLTAEECIEREHESHADNLAEEVAELARKFADEAAKVATTPNGGGEGMADYEHVARLLPALAPPLKLQYLVGLLLRRQARWRAAARPRIVVALSVFTPAGKPAVEIRL